MHNLSGQKKSKKLLAKTKVGLYSPNLQSRRGRGKMPIQGSLIRQARGEMKLGDMALKISNITGKLVTRQTVENWEKDRNKPTHSHLEALCQVTGKDPNFFYGILVDTKSTNSPRPAKARAKTNGKRAAAS